MITVESVEIVEEECDVFDIQVDSDESFIVAGVVVHNSAICRSLDPSKVWRLDDPKRPSPPLHLGCRTTVVPALDWKALGVAGRAPRVLEMRDYTEWLRAQSESEQNRLLGRTRAAAWRAGTVTLQDLVGSDLRPLTLAQLRDRFGLPRTSKAA